MMCWRVNMLNFLDVTCVELRIRIDVTTIGILTSFPAFDAKAWRTERQAERSAWFLLF